MSLIHSRAKYETVSSYDSSYDDYVPDNGEELEIRSFTGAAAYLDDTTVKLVWDRDGTPEIIVATHGDVHILMAHKLTGDGSKKLSLVLENDTSSAHVIGGSWEAKHLNE
jgi:hypothetical protein